MPGIFAGDTKALVFPVMCDGYIKLDYSGGDTSKNEEETELALRGGFWGHQGNFSIEAVITPYDVNGYGTNSVDGVDVGIVASEKTPPSLNADVTTTATKNKYQSFKYFGEIYTRRFQKMMIFHNSNFSFYLENNIVGSSNSNTFNINQPAEYRLVVKVNNTLVMSENVITANDTLYGYYDEFGLYEGTTTSQTLSGGSYVSQPKEALYLEGLYKVGCSYANGAVRLYINGNMVKEQITTGTFNFAPSDSFIGQNGTNTNTQFAGELYEICMYKRTDPTETNNTLTPGYNDILFYYRFGE